MTDENKIMDLIHSIVETYEKDVAIFAARGDRSTSKFAGRFNFKVFAKKFFDPISSDELGDTYVGLLQNASKYMHLNKKSRAHVPTVPYCQLSIPELLVNMILPYQLPQATIVETKKTIEEVDKNAENETTRKKNTERKANVVHKPRVDLTHEQSKLLLKEMLIIPMSHETKLWKQAKYILCPNGHQKLLSDFGEIIAEQANNGFISFVALNFFMHDDVLKKYLQSPLIIMQALYLGELNSFTVEHFASNRPDNFRQECREVLRHALNASRDPFSFQANEPQNVPKEHPDRIIFRQFAENVSKLVRDLSGEGDGGETLHSGWACAAIKKFGIKRYVDKTWTDENYYDLIWTVLAQRPNLKKFVCDVLEKQFNACDAARFWRRMQPFQMHKKFIQNNYATKEDPLKMTENYLNFPDCVLVIQFLKNENDLKGLTNRLKKLISKQGRVLIGVDAEWSAYTHPSKASILQIALVDCVFIVDLESHLISKNAYHSFLTFLFSTVDLVKIGFQFGEDLHQLRAAFRNIVALYEPENVICVGKIIMDVIDEVDKKPNSDEIKKQFLPFLNDNEAQNDDASSSSSKVTTESKSNESTDENGANASNGQSSAAKQTFMNKGLSFICEKILGRPLDKTEQCSVWDRRPLRNLQLRYAAMDAYCMLMLFDTARRIYTDLNMNVDEYIAQQTPIRCSLPLLSEYPL